MEDCEGLGIGAYRKFSDTWRRENAPETLGALDALGGVDGRFALGGQTAEGAPKASKIETMAGANAECTPPKPPKPPKALRYQRTFSALEARCPDHVPVGRWQQAVEDGKRFLAKWGEQAEGLGWDSRDLFGLHAPPERPHPSYRRLSRYDATGLCWLLQGKEVIALTADTATIRNPVTGTITTYRRFDKPAALDCESYFKCDSNAPQTI